MMSSKVVFSTRWLLLVVGFAFLLVSTDLAFPTGARAAQEELLKVCLNIWIIADSGTKLAERAHFENEDAALGEPVELVRTVLAEESLPRLNQIWGQCAIGFRLNIAKVMRLDRIVVGGQTLDKQLLGTSGEAAGLVVTDFFTIFNLLFEALRAVEKQLVGQEIGKVLFRCLNVFIVGQFLTPDGTPLISPLGVALLFDTRSIVRWREPGVAGLAHIVMAHEIGHNFGLLHTTDEGIDDQWNLMSPVYSVHHTNLLPVQCQRARRTILLRDWAEREG